MIDHILLEVLRCKLEAIADNGARTIQRTAISPVVADAGDCSCAIFDPLGGLIVGGGAVQAHFKTGSNGVKAILEKHGGGLARGDVFLVNDPYCGGGFHAQDVFIHQPVFADDTLVAWVGTSAHMMDMGGSVPGSFAPAATDCYQEALRFPPVRLARAFVEQTDVWDILRQNIRVARLVEMDMRALISGANTVASALEALIIEYSTEQFEEAVDELNHLSERELQRRIAQLTPGTYCATSWTEWSDELYRIPCQLTIESGKLIFDYFGASSQSAHYFNSKPYVIRSLLAVIIAAHLAQDLPFNEGIFRAFEIRCEPGSILDAEPPAPIGGPHLDVGQNAIEVAMRCMTMAIAASEQSEARVRLGGPSSGSGYGLHTWAGRGHDGAPDAWLMLDGSKVGCSAGWDRDGGDLQQNNVGRGSTAETADVEVLESWYPIFFDRRGPRRGPHGAGAWRAGHGLSGAYRPTSAEPLLGAILGNRERVPIASLAGGRPGGLTHFAIRGADGAAREAPCHSQGLALAPGETFEYDICCGGGWGDPLDRDPSVVEREIRLGWITADEAEAAYGVVQGDAIATMEHRGAMLAARLVRAEPPIRPFTTDEIARTDLAEEPKPLYPGVEQKGRVAVSGRTGSPLAMAPHHWTDGCPTIREQVSAAELIEIVTYLDPVSGHALAVDVVAQGAQRAFESLPQRWIAAAEPSASSVAERL